MEQRAPLGDRRAIEFSLRLPREQLLLGGEFRPARAPRLARPAPGGSPDATSRGYQGADWFEQFDVGQIRGMVEEIAANGTVKDLIDIEKMHRALDHWPSSFEGFDVYQRLLSTYRWRLAPACSSSRRRNGSRATRLTSKQLPHVLDDSRNIGNHVRGVAAAFQAENRCAPHKLDCGVEMQPILAQFRHGKSSIGV